MKETGREYLQEGERIFLLPKDLQNVHEEFKIDSIVGEGGTAVCYNAVQIRNGCEKRGTLKELYPIEGAGEIPRGNYRMVREKGTRQLCAEGIDLEAFHQRREEYLNAYQQIYNITKDQDQEHIGNFVQTGEVYYGIGDYNSATVYIWATENVGIDFDKYLKEIQKNPKKNAEVKLYDILGIVATLTERIQELHKAGYMHLDVKPSNILLVYQGKDKINPKNIVLCDIDSLRHVGSNLDYLTAGSEGYCAPELKQGRRPDHRSDIYSIGAVLFRAVVINDDFGNDGRYCDDYYDDIDVLVKNSKLITGSVLNSDDQLVELLADVLKKCLAKNPDERYAGCSALLKDLTIVTEKAKVTDEKREQAVKNELADAAIAIQKLLYERPLFESLSVSPKSDGKNIDIRVLVVGAGMYGQKFIDLCLQAGQMRGYALSITAVSDRPKKDCANYLRFRPDMSHFVDVYAPGGVGGSMEKVKGLAYGTIFFDSLQGADGETEFRSGNEAEISQWNRKLAADIVYQAEKQKKGYHYVFVALGEDELNRQVAQAFVDEMAKLDGGDRCCPVAFVWEGVEQLEELDIAGSPSPVLINRSLTPADIIEDLEQMSFNTDLVWSGESFANMDVKKQEFFSDAYRYSSSLAYVLSLKYKLYSLGISLGNGCARAAQEFSDKILSRVETEEDAREDYDMLAWLEHRRWVLDRAAEGWKAPRNKEGKLDVEKCVREGMVKNPINRTHPCMVFSSPEPVLMGEGYTADDRSNWEHSVIDPELDDLDKMSVQLHRCFRERADEVINENPKYLGYMEEIQHLVINQGENVNREYTHFRFCLQNIIDGVESYAKKYGNYKKQFQESLSDLPGEDRQRILVLLKDIDGEIFPVIEANLYRDYKKYDVDLVRTIPFILTFRPVFGIAMAFEDGIFQNGKNEATFADVASATVMCPREIHYLYCLTREKSAELFVDKVSAVLSYFNQRRMSCEIYLEILCLKNVDAKERLKLNNRLQNLLSEEKRTEKTVVFTDFKINDCFDYAEAAQKFVNYMGGLSDIVFDGSTQLFASAMGNGDFVRGVRDMGMPYFEFDWRKKQFTRHEGCEYLQYIEDNSYFTINDMFSLMKATDNRSRPLEFMDDYKDLWEIYTTNAIRNNRSRFSDSIYTWNILCGCLGDYEDSRKPLAKMEVDSEAESDQDTLVYELPRYTIQTVNRLLNRLIALELVMPESSLVSHTSENYRLTLVTNKTWEEVYDQVFKAPQYLLDYYDIQVNVFGQSKKTVRFTCNSMEVTDVNLKLDTKGHWNDRPYKLLEKLQEKKYIRNLRKDGDKNWIVSFAYSSPQIKELLTSAGRILEVYAYYEALKTGYFDDVATGYEFLWEESGVKNELDLVLTKGFHSIFVECKAVKKLDLEYYHKLHSLAEHFGVGAIKVLLGNTYMQNKDEGIDITNRMERSRGTQMNIKTISDKRDIENIGQMLKQVMEEQL